MSGFVLANVRSDISYIALETGEVQPLTPSNGRDAIYKALGFPLPCRTSPIPGGLGGFWSGRTFMDPGYGHPGPLPSGRLSRCPSYQTCARPQRSPLPPGGDCWGGGGLLSHPHGQDHEPAGNQQLIAPLLETRGAVMFCKVLLPFRISLTKQSLCLLSSRFVLGIQPSPVIRPQFQIAPLDLSAPGLFNKDKNNFYQLDISIFRATDPE